METMETGDMIFPIYISTHPDSYGQEFDSYAELKRQCPECAGEGLPYEVRSRGEA